MLSWVDACMQDLALQVLQGAAVLSYDFLQELNSQPPEALSKTAMMLHDNCLLVRHHFSCAKGWSRANGTSMGALWRLQMPCTAHIPASAAFRFWASYQVFRIL